MHHRAPLEADILWRGRIQAVTEEESRAILASITEEEKRVFRLEKEKQSLQEEKEKFEEYKRQFQLGLQMER